MLLKALQSASHSSQPWSVAGPLVGFCSNCTVWCIQTGRKFVKFLAHFAMLSRVLGFFTKRGKQLAGSDKAGNSYYRQLQNNEGKVSERRWVEFGGSSKVEPIPVEWNSWLNGRRKQPPTPEEMEELEARRRAIKVKADLLDKEEDKRRFRAKALQQGMNEDDVGPQGMTRFLQQVTGSDASAEQSDSGAQQQASEAEPIFKPNTWNPSVPSTKSGEAAGSGDKFKPGTWKP